MSHYRRHSLEPSITTKFRDSLNFQRDDDVIDKPDFRELDFGSPISPLRPRGSSSAAATPAASGSSSSSSGSASGKPAVTSQLSRRSHSGELSGICKTSPVKPGSVNRSLKPGHRRSASAGTPLIYSGLGFSPVNNNSSRGGGSGATSPNPGVLPTGNICPSGRILKTGMATRASVRPETLCTGTANYGHGNIIRSGGKVSHATKAAAEMGDSEEAKKAGNEMYRKGNYAEALALYDRAISLSPENPAYRSNRAAALAASGRLDEAVKECLEAVRFDPSYARAHQRLASLYLRLGEAENARRHLCISGQCPDQADLRRLQTLEKHLRLCTEARKIGDWRTVVSEIDAAIASGADSSPQLVACKAEAFLQLHQMKDSDLCLSNIPRLDHHHTQPPAKLFGIICDAYVLCVQAQVDMALGRFESAVVKAERAMTIDHSNSPEVVSVLNNVKNVAKSRTRGNELFSSGRYSEASVAYGDGLKFDAFNSVLYCNRAACWFKLGMWEKSVDDCNQALRIQPSYTKALLRRAASYGKLGRWEDAVRDYEVLRKELPGDSEVAESLQRARTALSNKSEEPKYLGFNNEVEEVSTIDKFKTATSLPGISVFHFKSSSNRQSEAISPFVNTLCLRYPLVHFFKVDVEESLALAKAESIKKVPTFKIYKNGEKVKEMIRGIPLPYVCVETVSEIAQELGQIVHIDFHEASTIQIAYIRVRIRFGITDSLRFFQRIRFDSGETVVIRFQYERLRRICSRCLRFTHHRLHCPYTLPAPEPRHEARDQSLPRRARMVFQDELHRSEMNSLSQMSDNSFPAPITPPPRVATPPLNPEELVAARPYPFTPRVTTPQNLNAPVPQCAIQRQHASMGSNVTPNKTEEVTSRFSRIVEMGESSQINEMGDGSKRKNKQDTLQERDQKQKVIEHMDGGILKPPKKR